MNKDEIILSCMDRVKHLVHKYNSHENDEDLQSVGMVAVVECVNRCLDEQMTDLDQIQARATVWARNSILTEIYKQRIKYSDDDWDMDGFPCKEDMGELLMYMDEVLTPKEKELFDNVLFGYRKEEIMNKMKIEKSTYYKLLQQIKEKIVQHA